MRPPILFLTVAFGVGLWAGLDPFVFPGRALPGGALWIVALPVVALAAWLAWRAPLGAAVGVMGGAGGEWGGGGGAGAGAGGGGTAGGGGGGGGRKGTRRGL